jgi:hypothetical protein
LDVDNELLRSQAFRKPDPLLDAATEWKNEMVEAGWHTCVCVNGWRCEQHGEQGWPHDDCAGPGVPCSNPVCEAGVTLRHQLAARRSMES